MIKNLGRAATNVLKTIVPTLATAVGSPVLGGLASSVLEAAFPGDTQAEIEAKIAEGSPETLLALKTANQDFEVRMRELDIDEQALYVGDTDKARVFSASTSIVPQVMLTILFLSIYAGLMYIFFTVDFELNDWQRGQMGILIGVATTAVVQIINFWFGSSKGSKDKDSRNGANN